MKVPSKKVSLVMLGTICVVIVIMLLSSNQNGQKETDSVIVPKPSAQIAIGEVMNVDTDGDGLLDWEETLWGTSQTIQDTDGDGTNDSDEIRQNRDPKKPGDDSTIQIEQLILENIADEGIDSKTLTGQVGTTFAQEYFSLRQDGTLTTEERVALSQKITDTVTAQINIESPYTVYSLKVFDDALDRNRILVYTKSFINSQISLIDVIQTPAAQADYEKFGTILIDAGRYLMSLEVPASIAATHVDLANNYHQLGQALYGMIPGQADPLLGLVSIELYNRTKISLDQNTQELANFFIRNGIIAKDGEYVFKQSVYEP